MELGLGVLQWSPKQFWSSTFPEFYAALDGVREFHGAEEAGSKSGPEKWSPNRVTETQDFIEQIKAKFPDGRPPKGYKRNGPRPGRVSARS